MMDLLELLHYTAEHNCSDLHLSSGEQPIVRKVGDLQRLDHPKLSNEQVQKMLTGIMTEDQKDLFDNQSEVDFSYTIPNVARFRINAFKQVRGASAAFRRLSFVTPSLKDVNLTAAVFDKICQYPNGLVLLTGATGSGKSTTLAAMINHINSQENRRQHILTIEDPVEYLFESKNCLIQQREIGKDTHFFHSALRSALREDPDIIMVGELRDLETIRLALTAAETGHLVFGTLHTSTASSTIDRIIDVFPGNEKDMIRQMLAESLRAVISQRLYKTPQNTLHPAHEILVSTGAVRNLIREHKVPQLYSAMQTGSQFGMHTLAQHVDELVKKELILPINQLELKQD